MTLHFPPVHPLLPLIVTRVQSLLTSPSFHLYSQTLLCPRRLPPSPPALLPLCLPDLGEGGGRAPPRSGTGTIPVPHRAEPGSSPHVPARLPLRTGQDLPVHLSGTRPCLALHRGAVGSDAPPTHPRGRHAGPRGLEGAQRKQRQRGERQGEGEREAVAAEGAEGDTDARHCAR